MRVLSAEQMRELDRRAIEEIGIPGAVLMENAGRGAAQRLAECYRDRFPGPILVLAGKGNNGGDGFVIARCLLQKGWQVDTLVLAERESITGDARLNLEILLRLSEAVEYASEAAALERALAQKRSYALLIDALFGTGLASAVRGHYAQAIAWINAQRLPVIAVDIPSGLDAGTGQFLGCCVQAELTLSFAQPKIGHLVYPGAARVGTLETIDIGIPAFLLEESGLPQVLVDGEEARQLLPARPPEGHKGTFGHLLVIAGSPGKSGAAAMTADAAVRGGCGLVTLGCPACIHDILEVKLTEPMTVALPQIDGALSLQALDPLLALCRDKQALALGPGLGQAEETQALVRRLMHDCVLPMVIDADGLNALAGHRHVLAERATSGTILTPHPGEMARLAAVSIEEIETDRVGFVRAFAAEQGVVLVLKGARTITAAPDGRIFINSSGHQGMASGGTGDILTGLIGAFLAQGLPPAEAAALGVYLHGRAADRLVPQFGLAGLAATDLLQDIPAARHELLSRSF
jgi:ADP-dependent NAD(P)H-hydrate dehydratase / NAD(P)H-hydrate epimerase